MKRNITVILFLFSWIFVSGQEAPADLLVTTAEKFISKFFPAGKHEITSVRPVGSDSLRTMYVVDLIPEGWILMSADQRVQPVLAFSLTGSYLIAEKNPENNQYLWINRYENEIKAIVSGKEMTRNDGWKGIFGSSYTNKGIAADIWVSSLIKVNWGQGNSWNRFCPPDVNGPGGHTYVGCVAVAMSQAMSVFKIPVNGYGTHSYFATGYGTQFADFGATTYKWDSMSLSLPDKYNALLLYHCAVSVNMEFGADGSASQTLSASAALKNYFYYSRQISYKKRFLIEQDWIDLLNQQLLKGRPIIYAGDADDGTPGHAFNIDGVVNSTYFHINWGWSGINNGYYTINSLKPGNDDFTKNNAAIFGIQPYYYPTDIVLTDTIVPLNVQAGTYVGVVKVIDEATDNVYTIKLKADSTFNGSAWIQDYYLKGDSLKTNRTFTGSDLKTDTVLISVSDKFGNFISRKITLNVGGSSTGIFSHSFDGEQDILLYPNPVTEYLFINNKSGIEISSLKIYSLSGSLLKRIENPAHGSNIQVSFLQTGIYILEVELSDKSIIRQKIIKQ